MMRQKYSLTVLTLILLLFSTVTMVPVLTANMQKNIQASSSQSLNPDVPPWIYITDPNASNPLADELYIVNWTDSDPDDNATITLYFDFDNQTGGEYLIGPVPQGENSTNNSYFWNTSGMPPGKYYIKAIINDTNATFTNYSIGYVNISHPIPGDIVPPVFNNNTTPQTGTTGDNFTLAINVTDDNWVGEVYVEYWIGTGAHTNTSLYWAGWTDFSNYTYTIKLPHTNESINYFFSAKDTSSPSPNWNNTTVVKTEIIDNDPPVPINGTGDFSIITGLPFSIYANFTDNINVTNATIYYKKVTAAAYTPQPMSEGVIDGQFSIDNVTLGINTTYDDDDYQYYVLANDTNNNIGNYTNLTVNNFTKPWNITIIDIEAPVSIDGSGDITVTTGDQFVIYANFTDNINLDNATIYLRPELDVNYTLGYMVESGVDGNFTITYSQLNIDTSNDDSNYIYHVIGKDNEGNTANYTDAGNNWNITVNDNDAPALVSNSGDIKATTGEIFRVDAKVTDNVNLTNVTILFKLESDLQFYKLDMTEDLNSPDDYYITSEKLSNRTGVDYTFNVTDYLYYLYGKDHVGNEIYFYNNSNPWRISITDNDPPQAIDGAGDFYITTGETFIVYVNFTDNIGVKEATIFYKQGESAPEFSKPMFESPTVDGQFSINNTEMRIFTETDDADYIYWITATDDENNEMTYFDPIDYYFSIIIIDDDIPQVIDGSGDISTTTGEDFTIYANFTDNIGVDNATIYILYKSTPLELYTIGYMQKDPDSGITEGLFSITNDDLNIDTSNDDTDFIYYVIARDFEGNIVNYTSAISGPYQGYFFITLIDNDPPSVHSGSGDIITTTGASFTIYANFTDNIGIETTELYYKSENATNWQTKAMIRILSEVQIARFFVTSKHLSINTTIDDTDYLYYVVAKDKNLLECQYCPKISKPVWNITVFDDDPPTAHAGEDKVVEDGTNVNFDASLSADNIGIDNYSWEFNYETEEKVLYTKITTFVFVTPGNYFVTLIVKDAAVNQDADTLWVNVTYIDRIAPTITSVHPLDNSENIPIDTAIVVKFSEPMDIDETNIAFFVMKDSNDLVIQGDFSYNENFNQDLYVLKFTPTITLEYEETYHISISTEPADTSGNQLQQARTWQFTTIAEDSDNDGLPDWWEEQYFGESKINEVGPSSDPDNDGFTNLEEYTEGTDPKDSESHPPLKAPKDGEEDNTYAIMAGIVVVFVIVLIIFLFIILSKSKQWKSEVKGELSEEEPIKAEAEEPAEEEKETLPPGEKTEEPEESEEQPPDEGAEKDALEDEQDESALHKEPGEGDEIPDEPDQELAATDEEFKEELDAADEELAEEIPAEIEELGEDVPTTLEPDAPDQIKGYATKAAELYQQGEYADAIIEWQKILELEPDHPEIMDSIQDAMEKLKDSQ